ncbi:MAG TPA: hypothetical protein PLY57_04985 [Deltaproteobacteria bacterium]|nr:hypothetical protein [Deltaproteobacteria bacterium]
MISCSKSNSDDAPVAVSDNVLDTESLTFSLGIIEDDPLEITIESSKEYIATLKTVSEITGAYELPAKTWTLNAHPGLNVDVERALSDSFIIQIIDPLQIDGAGYPISGRLRILSPMPETISIVFRDSQNMDFKLNSGNEVPVVWSGLMNLLSSDDTPDWQKGAALACFLISCLITETDSVLDTIFLIEQNEDTIISEGRVTFEGDEFPDAPPSGISKKGSSHLSFTDMSGDSKAGPGDDFTWTYYNMWDASSGMLSIGAVYLVNYLRNVEVTNRVGNITSIGFPSSDGGGVVYDYVTRHKISSESPHAIEYTITFNGGFTVVFEK